MYDLAFLIDTFTKHAEEAHKNHELARKQFLQMNPNETLPEHMVDDFNLPMALATICHEIEGLKNAR